MGKIPNGDLSVAVRTSIKIYDHGAIRQRDVSVRDGRSTAKWHSSDVHRRFAFVLGRVLCCHPIRWKVATAGAVRRGGNLRVLTERNISLRGIYHFVTFCASNYGFEPRSGCEWDPKMPHIRRKITKSGAKTLQRSPSPTNHPARLRNANLWSNLRSSPVPER